MSDYSNYISKLITPDQYDSNHPKPYIFEASKADKAIYFFGAKHSADPNEPQFSQIEQAFAEFEPDLVIVEAAPGPKGLSREEFNAGIMQQSSTEVIQRRGEPGFTIRLAVENEVEWFCPEPDRMAEASYLLEQAYAKAEVQAFALFRNIPVFNKRRGNRTFTEFAQGSIDRFLERTNWELDNSLERIIAKGEEMIGEDVDVENDMNIHKYINPGEGNKLREMARLSWAYRDHEILRNILDKLQNYKRIFAVYGSSHAVVQEPAIIAYFSKLAK